MTPAIKKSPRSILIVEDDAEQLARYLAMAKAIGLVPRAAKTKDEALAILAQQSFQFVLTDIHLSGPGSQNTYEGLTVLANVRENMPEAVPLAMTSDPNIDTYNRVMSAGAAHSFRKPILSKDELALHLDLAQVGRRSRGIVKRRPELSPRLLQRCPDGIVLADDIRAKLRKYAINGVAPVVISGETGTGKEEVAKLLHRLRTEAHGPSPFIAVNCANLSGDTAISTLFGHRKGAFTGADETTTGYIGAAHQGILFLDEVHALSIECQQRLLRVLNDGGYNRFGDAQTLFSDFQPVIASTKNLDAEVAAGRFLLDLRTRLTGLDIKLPPLRERLQDLPLLIEIGLGRQGVTIAEDQLEELAARCRRYYWQGNLRQLFQVLQALVIEAEGNATEICADDLPEYVTMFAPGGQPLPAASNQLVPSQPDQALQLALTQDCPFQDVMKIIETAIIGQAFKRHGSTRAVAKALGMSKSTLARMRGPQPAGDDK